MCGVLIISTREFALLIRHTSPVPVLLVDPVVVVRPVKTEWLSAQLHGDDGQ